MAKRRRSSTRGRRVIRVARRAYSTGRRRGFFGGKSGGSLTSKTWNAFKDGNAYGIVAGKFAPQFAPIAKLYGEYKGGGFEGLLINELVVNPLLGQPSALGGLGLNLGNIFNLGGGGGAMPKQSV